MIINLDFHQLFFRLSSAQRQRELQLFKKIWPRERIPTDDEDFNVGAD